MLGNVSSQKKSIGFAESRNLYSRCIITSGHEARQKDETQEAQGKKSENFQEQVYRSLIGIGPL